MVGKKKLIKQLKKMMKHLAKEEVKSQDAQPNTNPKCASR